MKKLLSALAALVVPASVWAAATITETHQKATGTPPIEEVRVLWTADTDGTIPDYTINSTVNGYIYGVETWPGQVTAPTDNYDIDLLEVHGSGAELDIDGGELENRDSASGEQVILLVDAAYTHPAINTAWRDVKIRWRNNSVASATGEVVLLIKKS